MTRIVKINYETIGYKVTALKMFIHAIGMRLHPQHPPDASTALGLKSPFNYRLTRTSRWRLGKIIFNFCKFDVNIFYFWLRVFSILIFLSTQSYAQFLLEFNTDQGTLIGGLEIAKTSDIGKFDDYAGPLLASEVHSFLRSAKSSNSVTSLVVQSASAPNQNTGLSLASVTNSKSTEKKNNVNIISNFISKDRNKLDLSYAGRLGWKFTVGYETSSFYNFSEKGLRILISKNFDFNALKAYAPYGIGILIDPTHLLAAVRIENTALTIEAPVHMKKFEKYEYTSYLGLGAIRNRTRSHGSAISDFLNISIIESRVIDRPLFLYSFRLRPVQTTGTSSIGFDMSAQIFRTTKMFNLNLNMALVKTFR